MSKLFLIGHVLPKQFGLDLITYDFRQTNQIIRQCLHIMFSTYEVYRSESRSTDRKHYVAISSSNNGSLGYACLSGYKIGGQTVKVSENKETQRTYSW